MAYTAVGLPSDIDALTDAIERGRMERCRRRAVIISQEVFISQDVFNDIIRYGTIYEIAMAVEKHREMVVGFDGRRMSPLMCAADRVNATRQELDTLLTLLIRCGAKMDAGCFSQSTPLCYAATKTPQVVRAFSSHETNWELYASFETKPWQIALRVSEENFAAMLPCIPVKLIAGYDALGQTPLIELIVERPFLASKLIAQLPWNMMVNIPDANGEAPLAHAAKLDRHRYEVVSALLRCGATLLYYKNDKAIFWGYGSVDATAGIIYIRNRIRFAKNKTLFDDKYDRWYE